MEYLEKEARQIFLGNNCQENNVKKAILHKSIGKIAYSILHSVCRPHFPISKSYKDIYEILSNHYTPLHREGINFHNATEDDDQIVTEWFARVKKLTICSKSGEHLKALIKDICIMQSKFSSNCIKRTVHLLHDEFKKAWIIEIRISYNANSVDNHAYCVNEFGFYNYPNNKQKNDNEKRGSKEHKHKPCKHRGWKSHYAQYCKFRNNKSYVCGRIRHIASACRVVDKCHGGLYTLPVEIDSLSVIATCDTGVICTFLSSFLKDKIL